MWSVIQTKVDSIFYCFEIGRCEAFNKVEKLFFYVTENNKAQY